MSRGRTSVLHKLDRVAWLKIMQNTICMKKWLDELVPTGMSHNSESIRVWFIILGYNTHGGARSKFSVQATKLHESPLNQSCAFLQICEKWNAEPKIIPGTKSKYLSNEIHGQFDSKYMLIHGKKWFSWMNNATTAWDNPLPKWFLYLHCELFKSW